MKFLFAASHHKNSKLVVKKEQQELFEYLPTEPPVATSIAKGRRPKSSANEVPTKSDMLIATGAIDIETATVEDLQARLDLVTELISIKRSIEQAEDDGEYQSLQRQYGPKFKQAQTARAIDLKVEETQLTAKLQLLEPSKVA